THSAASTEKALRSASTGMISQMEIFLMGTKNAGGNLRCGPPARAWYAFPVLGTTSLPREHGPSGYRAQEAQLSCREARFRG
ncbi:MAG: hypothetical protein ACHQ1H_14275, partial [Nitrososphaerales archaeon]